ncbi:hypothetical protein [Bacillus atrophaeus]
MKKIRNLSFHFFIIGQLQTFKDYADYIEHNLGRELYDFEESMKELSDDEKEEFVDWHYDEIAQYRDDFPTI